MQPPPANHPAAGDIVIFQPEFVEFGGEERVILSLSRELHAQGKKHSVLCYWDEINLAKYANWPLTVHQLLPARNPVAKLLSLRRCLRRLHLAGSPVPALFSIQSAYHAGLAVNSPYHVRIPDTFRLLVFNPEGAAPTVSTLPESVKTRLSKVVSHAATGRGIRRATCFVTNTVALREEMKDLYGRSAQVIYLGGFGGPAKHPPHRTARPIELLTVSRLQSSKRIDWILSALADVQGKAGDYPAWHLNVAGTGPDEDALKQMSLSLGLDARVTFHGFVSDEQLNALYEKSHVFLMPAKQGYGLPAIEALYQRLGLVVSEESGVVELLEMTPWATVARDGKAGFAAALKEMLVRVGDDGFSSQPLPELPTEEGWAKKMILEFGW